MTATQNQETDMTTYIASRPNSEETMLLRLEGEYYYEYLTWTTTDITTHGTVYSADELADYTLVEYQLPTIQRVEHLTHKEAVAYLLARPGKAVHFKARYQNGDHYRVNCWLEDGELVHSHPTRHGCDASGNLWTCAAPTTVRYYR